MRCSLLTILLVLIPASADAQKRTTLLLELPASTRALALGDAFPVGQTDSDGLFYAPAFHDRLRGAGGAVQSFDGEASLIGSSAAIEWWHGALAIGVRSLSYLAYAPPTAESALLADEGAQFSERAMSLGYGRTVRGVRLGATAHAFELRASQLRARTAAFDVGAGFQALGFAAALTARSLGRGYEIAGGWDTDLPSSLELAVGRPGSIGVGPLDLVPAARVEYGFEGGLDAGGGLEASYWPVPGRTFTVRAGMRSVDEGGKPWTAGAAFTGDRIIIDYAWVPYEDGLSAHRLGIRWR